MTTSDTIYEFGIDRPSHNGYAEQLGEQTDELPTRLVCVSYAAPGCSGEELVPRKLIRKERAAGGHFAQDCVPDNGRPDFIEMAVIPVQQPGGAFQE